MKLAYKGQHRTRHAGGHCKEKTIALHGLDTYNGWKTPEEQNKPWNGFLTKRRSEVGRASLGETVWRDVECMNMTWEDVCHEATDRRQWKEWTARCAPSTGRTKV